MTDSLASPEIDEVLFSQERIEVELDRIAGEILQDWGDGDGFTVVSVLKGSFVFASDLVRRLPVPIELAFAAVSSYGKGTRSGPVSLDYAPTIEEIRGRRCLLVDDILDSGRTLAFLSRSMEESGATEVRTCVFLDKPSRRQVAFEADYTGFQVGNRFVVGYGLDFAGRYRNLPYVAALKPTVEQAAASHSASDLVG